MPSQPVRLYQGDRVLGVREHIDTFHRFQDLFKRCYFFFHIVSTLNSLKAPDTFQCMLGCFGVSIIHQTLTWGTGSLTSVSDLFACLHAWGTSVYGLIWRTLVRWGQVKSLKIGHMMYAGVTFGEGLVLGSMTLTFGFPWPLKGHGSLKRMQQMCYDFFTAYASWRPAEMNWGKKTTMTAFCTSLIGLGQGSLLCSL